MTTPHPERPSRAVHMDAEQWPSGAWCVTGGAEAHTVRYGHTEGAPRAGADRAAATQASHRQTKRESMTTPRTCRGRRVDGEPCAATLGLSDDGYCLQHDPARADEAQAVRAAGGKAAGKARREAAAAARPDLPPGMPRRRPRTLDDAVRWSSWSVLAVATGAIDARTAHEISVLLQTFTKAVERREVLRKIDSLSERLEQVEQKRRPA